MQASPPDDQSINEAVYRRILGALYCGKLSPRQRLPETAIARVLGVSRERVRRALHRLSHEGCLELVPNKGACVPELNEDSLEKIFAARRLIEGAVVRQLAERATSVMVGELEAHLEAEAEAARNLDRRRQIPLSRDFHTLLIEQLDNPWLSGFLRQVATPTMMAYALFAPQQLPNCGGPHEHRAIVKAIGSRDPDNAARLMTAHLDNAMAHVRRLRKRVPTTSIEIVLDSLEALDTEPTSQ